MERMVSKQQEECKVMDNVDVVKLLGKDENFVDLRVCFLCVT